MKELSGWVEVGVLGKEEGATERTEKTGTANVRRAEVVEELKELRRFIIMRKRRENLRRL
jgi:hypothetical protein